MGGKEEAGMTCIYILGLRACSAEALGAGRCVEPSVYTCRSVSSG